MVTKVIFLTKSFDPFQKWTKKMSKIEKSKKLLDNFFIKKVINKNQCFIFVIWTNRHVNVSEYIFYFKKN